MCLKCFNILLFICYQKHILTLPLFVLDLRYGAHTDYQGFTILRADKNDWNTETIDEVSACCCRCCGCCLLCDVKRITHSAVEKCTCCLILTTTCVSLSLALLAVCAIIISSQLSRDNYHNNRDSHL